MRDATEDALRDAAHDAFMALWRGAECEQSALWDAYCAAQTRYDAYLMRRRATPPSVAGALTLRRADTISTAS